ncbi:uncharacterized protein LOC117606948 [Osmia lignaria lignaria]|uniref:uncharacterized protein LOC117606948 n=1 Tax=Osmia lignaria lignaria TaxID=1437193 RepID=UPI00402BE0BE
MEQVDEEQIDTVQIKPENTQLSSSLDSETNINNVTNIPDNQESSSSDYTNNVIQNVFPINECDIKEDVKIEIIDNLYNYTVNESQQEVVNHDTQIDDNQYKKNEKEYKENQVNDLIECKHESTEGASLDKESTKFSNNTELINIDKDKQTFEKHDVCTVLNIDTVGDTNAQCQALIKTLSQTFEDKDQSLHDADTNADLSTLNDGNSEVMVVTVETVRINDSNESTEENIVLTVREKDVAVDSNENDTSVNEKKIKDGEIVNEEFNLIDYTQENEGTIIEVISTEVVDSEIPETYKKEILNRTVSEKDSITSTTSEEVKSQIPNNANVYSNKIEERYNVGEEDKTKLAEIKDEGKTEICDSSFKSSEIVLSKVVTPVHVDNLQEENISTNEVNKINASNKRSVIQDIFDDWRDENAEDDNQSASKMQDTVEIELKTLLNDTKTIQTIEEDAVVLVEEEVTCLKEEFAAGAKKVTEDVEIVKENKDAQISKEQISNNQPVNKHVQNNIKPSHKDQVNSSVSQNSEHTVKDTTHDSVTCSQISSSQTPVTSVSRGRNLTSQIASPAEVTEALKERLREKQKIVEAPPGPDIFFVKKLTQRLSSKLAGSPASSLPALIPLPQSATQPSTHCDKKSIDNTSAAANKESSSDNKELLAILEGDVDPDWSNLKPPTLTEEGKNPINVEHSGHNTPPKLDPLIERELALKQLLELPVNPVKRSAPRKKKTSKPSEVSKEVEAKPMSDIKKQIVNIDLIDETTESSVKDTNPESESESSPTIIEQHTLEKSIESNMQDVRLDESRSGRKRKPTEKAREHEQQQNIVKRQKINKSKTSLKKQIQEKMSQITADVSLTEDHVSEENILPANNIKNDVDVTITKVVTNKQGADNNDKVDSVLNKSENILLKRPKQSLSKKASQSITTRNMVVKKILRPNMPSNKKAISLKTKLNTPSKKTGSKIVSKSKRVTENNPGDSKPKKKIINEIDRLLQDEGVVNLLYDVEQPDKKRLIPITKSQAKVMDIQKVQRELKIRKKLVRNAVLRLRTSTSGVSKVSPRSKRTSVYLNDMHLDKKIGDQVTTVKPVNETSQEFILPAKIRNAADASVIIRRHSSSSFSSASGSPRVSIDSPEKNDGVKIIDEGGSHSLRSTKRRLSQEDKTNAKKIKKKTVPKIDTETVTIDTREDKMIFPPRLNKKSDPKKTDNKSSKQSETTLINETNSGLGKVITRSNGAATGKVTSKTKKTAKNKVTFGKANEQDNEEFSKEEDELSACLAEAANALSVVSAGSRSGSSTANRKSKVNANITKVVELDNKTKMETRSQFSNKEINVRRHGNLVQLILTPSSSTKIRNALTLQVMQEFRETLSILRKDDDCRVVLLTSTGSSFCEGLELSTLLHANKEERRIRAEEVADAVKDFIKTLASFNKPIVAGVQGSAVGLGVTMLPLFDLVIASDKATFSTPYGKLGQIAEGAAVYTLSHILGSAITSELLLGGRTLTASEALRAGLVTRVLWPDRFQVELLPTLKAMSEQSSQSMEATKTLLRHSLRKKLDAALESETYLLIQHWCSIECQNAIKAYIDGKVL